jgi:hypothetical protein
MFKYYDIQVTLPESKTTFIMNDISEWTRFKIKLMQKIPFISTEHLARYIVTKCIVNYTVKSKDLLKLSHADYIYLMDATTNKVLKSKESL